MNIMDKSETKEGIAYADSILNTGVNVDLRVLFRYVINKYWIVLLSVFISVAIVSFATSLMKKEYQASAMVRMGSVKYIDSGVQGLALERLKNEIGGAFNISFDAKPTNVVTIYSNAKTAEEAFKNANVYAKLLEKYSKEVTETSMHVKHKHINNLEFLIEDVNQKIKQHISAHDGNNVQEQLNFLYSNDSIRYLLRLQEKLFEEIVKAKLISFDDVIEPQIISPAVLSGKPVRPHWFRNIMIAVFLGVFLGSFTVVLLGIIDQIKIEFK